MERVSKIAGDRGLTADQLLNELLASVLRGVWLTRNVCGARVKAKNITDHTAKVHLNTIRTQGLTGQSTTKSK